MTSSHSCAQCGLDAKLKCSRCQEVWYCKGECQKLHFPRHKVACKEAVGRRAPPSRPQGDDDVKEQGFPRERVDRVHDSDGVTLPSLVVPTAKEEKKEMKKIQKTLILEEVRQHLSSSKSAVVDEATFKAQFDEFTCSLLADWGDEQWENVLVAGGAVLGSLLPVPPDFARVAITGNYFDYDFRGEQRRRDDLGESSREHYLQKIRWPTADIDVFFYGLESAEEAQAKLLSLLQQVRRSCKLRMGMDHDVVFIRTQNTVTVETGCGRHLQFILRIYESRDDILNGFDLDCCCVGYDGKAAWITERCVAALRTKINVVNLAIRGRCYEARLLKYAERGFAISVPELDRSKIGREHLASTYKLGPSWYDYDDLTGEGFASWTSSRHLEELLAAECISRQAGGLISKTFPGRRRQLPDDQRELLERKLQFAVIPNLKTASSSFVRDGYGGDGPSRSKYGIPVWPATTKIHDIELNEQSDATKKSSARLDSVIWVRGNMERHPLTYEAWAASCLLGSSRSDSQRQSEEEARRREVREREAKRKRDAEAKAEARRVDLEAVRRDAAADAEQLALEKAEFAEAKERTAAAAVAAEKKMRRDQKRQADELNKLREQQRHETAKRETAEEELRNIQLLFNDTLNNTDNNDVDADEQRLCVVCLDEPKNVSFEPCRHMACCEACAETLVACPICRAPCTNKVGIYL